MLAAGSPVRNNARIFDAVRAAKPTLTADLLEMVRRNEVAQQVLDRTWDVLGREPFGFLHRELMALEPNSEEARTKIVDLAFHLGRYDDALELGLDSSSLRDQLYRLFAASGSLGVRETRLVPEPCTVLADNSQAYEIEGWIAAATLTPLHICSVLVGRRHFSIEAYDAASRNDVAASRGHNGNPLVGFKLTVVEAPGPSNPSHEVTTPINIDRAGHDSLQTEGPIVLVVQGRHDVRTVAGWIDRLTPVCRRLVRLPLAGRTGFTGRLEFLLQPQPQDARIVCKSEASPLIWVGDQRFEAFSTGISSLGGTAEELDLTVFALYSSNEFSVVEAVAYRWN